MPKRRPPEDDCIKIDADRGRYLMIHQQVLSGLEVDAVAPDLGAIKLRLDAAALDQLYAAVMVARTRRPKGE